MTENSMILEKRRAGSFTAGLALFSMFFGAGNLIFPILIGRGVGENVWFAICGLGLTAVVIPFLGLAAMLLFNGDIHRFFARMGKIPGMVLLLLLQLILGPLGVIPRLITLMHATVEPYCGLPLMVFNMGMALLIFGCSFKRQRLIPFLGLYFTPLLLLSLAALVIMGFMHAPTFNPLPPNAAHSFLQGLVGGYNTMDLIAAFLFATVVLPYFQSGSEQTVDGERSLMKKLFFSSVIAASLLLLTYIGLSLIAARHGWEQAGSSEQILGKMANKLLGVGGGLVAAIAILTACLTTAISLSSIFAEYLRKDLFKGKMSFRAALILTLMTTTLFANLGFGGIASFLGPILQIIYPGLILLTVLSLLHSLFGYKFMKSAVFFLFIIGAGIYFFQR